MLFPRFSLPVDPPRVVITGAGIVTALGLGWAANAAGFRVGRQAFRPVTLFEVSRQRSRIAAEVDLPARLPRTRLPERVERRLDRAARMLLLAVHEAWHQAAWEPSADLPLVLGTSSGGMSLGEDYYRQAVSQPRCHRRQVSRALHYQADTQGRIVADAFGFHGSATIVANACASGTNAIGMAWELIRRGRAERVLAGGYDALSLMVFAGFDSLQALSRSPCRPFGKDRDGTSLGEGAAALTLETLDSACRRGATILGEMIGYGSTLDLHHLTQPQPEGGAAFETMSRACASAGIAPAAVDYVNAHGTATSLNDSAEAQALNRWAGEGIGKIPVSSTKASIGHLLGAAGTVEAVVGLMTLREQWLPPQTFAGDLDPLCRFPVVRAPRDAKVNVVLSNSFGFGGSTASLLLRRWA